MLDNIFKKFEMKHENDAKMKKKEIEKEFFPQWNVAD